VKHSAKSLTRLYFSGELHVGRNALLPRAQARHAVRVLRLRPGSEIALFNGDGKEYSAVIERVAEDGLIVRIRDARAADREGPLAVTLAQALSSGERMDFTLQKAVELGVASIQPLATSRSVVHLDAERAAKRVAHWQSVVISACEQCGRNRVPRVEPLRAFDSWVRGLEQKPAGALRLLLSPRGPARLRDLETPAASILLLAGPEGGLAPDEEDDALAAEFSAVRLGPRVLRTETAALAALAAVQTLWGDF
jgi:16S rRNA (uracil1498-N3)-methyltransferase